MPVGNPTLLTPDVTESIREGVLNGLTLEKIAEINQINIGTLYQWTSKNFQNLSDKIEQWKRDRKIRLAAKNVEDILGMNTEVVKTDVTGSPYRAHDGNILRVKADMSQFVLKTLDKDNYSERNEVTGAGGKDLVINVVAYVPNYNSVSVETRDTPIESVTEPKQIQGDNLAPESTQDDPGTK